MLKLHNPTNLPKQDFNVCLALKDFRQILQNFRSRDIIDYLSTFHVNGEHWNACILKNSFLIALINFS
jgi:hypothetical protein